MIPPFIQQAIDEKLDHMRNIADHYANQVAKLEAAVCFNAYALTVYNPHISSTHLTMTSYPSKD